VCRKYECLDMHEQTAGLPATVLYLILCHNILINHIFNHSRMGIRALNHRARGLLANFNSGIKGLVVC
jgi:hypothetical protein